eukprot:SAG11_NODE_2046_length_3884_cov_2.228005_5_plen_74_part_00
MSYRVRARRVVQVKSDEDQSAVDISSRYLIKISESAKSVYQNINGLALGTNGTELFFHPRAVSYSSFPTLVKW